MVDWAKQKCWLENNPKENIAVFEEEIPFMSSRTFANATLPYKIGITLLVLLSMGSLIPGLFSPVIAIKQEIKVWILDFSLGEQQFSVLSGIETLFFDGHPWIAGILILFSVLFPIAKISLLCYGWFGGQLQSGVLRWVNVLGKWSMLDVFVLAVLIVVIKMNDFSDAKAMYGLHFFAFHVLSSMALGQLIAPSFQFLRTFRSSAH